MILESGDSKLEKIQRGWHEWFAWYPVQVLDERWPVWMEDVERKFYATNGRRAIKKDLNEHMLRPYSELQVMYRTKGSNAEKTTYIRRNGCMYVDPNEAVQGIPEEEWNRIHDALDNLEE